MGRVLPGQRRILPQVGEALGHDAVVQHRRRLFRDPAEVAAGAVETPVDHRFEQGLLAGPDRLRQIAVLQRAQKLEGLGDPGQRLLGGLARETHRRVVHQAAHLAREPGVELAREHLVGLKTDRAVAPKLVARPWSLGRRCREQPICHDACHVRLRSAAHRGLEGVFPSRAASKRKAAPTPGQPRSSSCSVAGDFGALDPVDATVCSCAVGSAFRVIGAQWPRQGTRQQGRRQRGIGSIIARGIKCSQRHLSCEKRALELLMSRTLSMQASNLEANRRPDSILLSARCFSYQRLKFPTV